MPQSPTIPCRQIAICGHNIDSVKIVADLIQRSATTRVDILAHRSVLDVEAPHHQTTITHDPLDVFALKRLFEQTKVLATDLRIILLMRDPRDLMLMRDPRAGKEFAYGYDHRLHISKSGLVTLSEPGIVYTQAVLEAATKRFGQRALVLRHEDLEQRPDLVQLALERFTGLSFAKSFAALLAKDERWTATTNAFIHRPASVDSEEAERLVRQFRLAPELFQTLERWKYTRLGDRRWFDELCSIVPEALDDKPGTIVGFFTQNTAYEGEAERLANSTQQMSLPLELVPIEAGSDWLAGVRMKPGVLLELRRRLRGPLLYVDVDAIIHKNPWPYLRSYRGDVAVSGHKDEAIISGTVLLNDTVGAIRFVEAWIAAHLSNPESWDQHSLQSVVQTHRQKNDLFRIQYLPPTMCRVFDRHYNPPVHAVIEHLQASRERFATSKDPLHIRNLQRRRQRVAELASGICQLDKAGSRSFSDMPADVRRKQTSDLIIARKSDLARWMELGNLKSAWASRARRAAALIHSGDRVLDLGCGAMDLEAELPDGATYCPVDLVSRDARTLICDLNSGQLPEAQADVVTMLGVLEYCHDLIFLLKMLANRWPQLIVTYNPSDLDRRRDRLAHGWFNNLSSAELIAIAIEAGYNLQAVVPVSCFEQIYWFSTSNIQP
jgi:hypothetical protein